MKGFIKKAEEHLIRKFGLIIFCILKSIAVIGLGLIVVISQYAIIGYLIVLYGGYGVALYFITILLIILIIGLSLLFYNEYL